MIPTASLSILSVEVCEFMVAWSEWNGPPPVDSMKSVDDQF